MQNNIEIINKKSSVEINIEGTIGVPEAWQFDEPQDRITTYDKFREAVGLIRQVEAKEIVVNIRSTGGDVNDALLIHDAISGLKGRKRTRCYGYTASAATIIAQAASEGCREISANALYLIHASMCAADGNATELEAKIDMLRKTDERIAAVYATRSGRQASEFEALMSENNGAGRWLSPDETVAAGLADGIISTPEVFNIAVVNEEPIQNYSMKIKNTYNGILRRLGLAAGDGAEVEVTEEQIGTLNQSLEQSEQREQQIQAQLEAERAAHSQARGELGVVQNRVATLEAELAQAKALPTTVDKIEDPAPGGEGALSGNAKAYSEDIKKFKQ